MMTIDIIVPPVGLPIGYQDQTIIMDRMLIGVIQEQYSLRPYFPAGHSGFRLLLPKIISLVTKTQKR